MRIIIENKEIEIKNSFKAMMYFEQINETSFETTTLTNVILYFYCCVLANKAGVNLTFDEFIEWLDENQDELNNFITWLGKVNKKNELLVPQDEDNKEGSKKK